MSAPQQSDETPTPPTRERERERENTISSEVNGSKGRGQERRITKTFNDSQWTNKTPRFEGGWGEFNNDFTHTRSLIQILPYLCVQYRSVHPASCHCIDSYICRMYAARSSVVDSSLSDSRNGSISARQRKSLAQMMRSDHIPNEGLHQEERTGRRKEIVIKQHMKSTVVHHLYECAI